MIFITNNQTSIVLKPGEQPLHFPPFSKSSQGSTVLRDGHSSIAFMRCNQIDAHVPSINPSLRSMPPRSFKSWANAVRILVKTPDSVHSWKRRWQVLFGGYRSGKSAHWAPVRRIHRMPLRTDRKSCGGRPGFPGCALGFGRYPAIRCHCSFVRSITHISALTNLIIKVLG